MSTYLTEEEQIEEIKKWWKNWGNFILTAIALCILAITGYHWWQQRNTRLTEAASTQYVQMISNVSNKDSSVATAHANSLISNFSNTPYASVAHLLLAKQAVDSDKLDLATKQLQTVVKTSTAPLFKQLARIRLARILNAQKHYTQAIDVLKTVDDKSFQSLIAEVLGDTYLAQGKKQQARAQYKIALDTLPKGGAMNRPLLEMKYNDTATI